MHQMKDRALTIHKSRKVCHSFMSDSALFHTALYIAKQEIAKLIRMEWIGHNSLSIFVMVKMAWRIGVYSIERSDFPEYIEYTQTCYS